MNKDLNLQYSCQVRFVDKTKVEIAKYLYANSPKRKTWLEYNRGKNKNQFANETEEMNTKIISKGYC